MKRGGYRIAKKLKQKLIDIDRLAQIGHDSAALSDNLSKREKIILTSNYNQIRRIIKELISEE